VFLSYDSLKTGLAWLENGPLTVESEQIYGLWYLKSHFFELFFKRQKPVKKGFGVQILYVTA